MGRNTFFQIGRRETGRPWDVHPLWRGIGCLMIILIPVLSFAGAVLLVDANIQNGWLYIPREFLWPSGNPLLLSQIGVAVILSMFGYFLFVIFYILMYKFIGPPTLGPTDSPPIRPRKGGKKFSR
jgi:hypothetical protein